MEKENDKKDNFLQITGMLVELLMFCSLFANEAEYAIELCANNQENDQNVIKDLATVLSATAAICALYIQGASLISVDCPDPLVAHIAEEDWIKSTGEYLEASKAKLKESSKPVTNIYQDAKA